MANWSLSVAISNKLLSSLLKKKLPLPALVSRIAVFLERKGAINSQTWLTNSGGIETTIINFCLISEVISGG